MYIPHQVDPKVFRTFLGTLNCLGGEDRKAITDLFFRAAAVPEDRAALHPEVLRDDMLHITAQQPMQLAGSLREQDR
jgi:hypothetical protein